MNNFGVSYDNGRGLERNYVQAAYWIRKSADGGNAVAMRNLGKMYEQGRGVPQDKQQAIFWFRKAADLGDTGAAIHLKQLGASN